MNIVIWYRNGKGISMLKSKFIRQDHEHLVTEAGSISLNDVLPGGVELIEEESISGKMGQEIDAY